MFVIPLFWRLARRRWARRVLLWLVVRLIRRFGWRRAVRLVFWGRHPLRLLAAGVWHVTVRLLRWGGSALLLVAWSRARESRLLGRVTGEAMLPSGSSWQRRLRAADAGRTFERPRQSRADLQRRLARRRDHIRRSVLAAVGVDPNWRPARSTRALGPGPASAGDRVRAPGDRSSGA